MNTPPASFTVQERQIGPAASGRGELLRRDGWLLFVSRAAGMLLRRSRDRLLARKLGTTGLRLGKHPHLGGLTSMRIGKNFSAGKGLWLEAIVEFAGESFSPELCIGDDCNVSDNVHIACAHRITLGPGLLAGSHVIISDHSHGVYRGDRQSSPELRPVLRPLSRDGEVRIGRNVWLGDGVAVLAGAEIGDGCIVGANAVVNGKLPPRTICVGAPARPVRRWEESSQAWATLPK